MNYNLKDRLKEWTTYAGIAITAIGAVVPQFVPQAEWVHFWQVAQMLIGAAMMALPQTAGSMAVENESLALLKAFVATLPPAYAQILQPTINMLAAAAVKHPDLPPPPIPTPAPTVAPIVIPAQPVPRVQPGQPAPVVVVNPPPVTQPPVTQPPTTQPPVVQPVVPVPVEPPPAVPDPALAALAVQQQQAMASVTGGGQHLGF